MWEGHSSDLQMDDSEDFVLQSGGDKRGAGADSSNGALVAAPPL